MHSYCGLSVYLAKQAWGKKQRRIKLIAFIIP